MDLLHGIQEIPGQTAGEKLKHINLTAKEIVDKKCQDVKFPKQLEPLLNVEVAKLSHDTKVIVEALISSDSLLCQRALQIPDLFTSKDSPLLNWEYFYNQLLSRVSFTTHCKIIKKLEVDLQRKDPQVAEEFYLNISKMYGEKQAHPLLLACSENFICERIEEDNLVLSTRNVTKLFQKFPALVTKYLIKLNDSKKMDLDNLYKFLPNLIDDHFELFVTLCEKQSHWRVSLGKRRTKVFLKKRKQLLIEKPEKFLDILSLEIVAAKLSMDEFATMLSKLFDKKMSDFDISSVSVNLKIFPIEKQCSLIQAAFKKAYGEDLVDHPELVDDRLLILFPTELRIRIAEMKLEKDSEWNLHNLDISWRMYLPFNRIFEDVKTQISKRSDANERSDLIKLLILCCKVNKDTDSFLQLLKYIQARHKNEKFSVWYNIMKSIDREFETEKLKQEHWDIFIEILQKLELSESYNFQSLYTSYLPQGIKFKFLNKLDPDEYMKYYLKLMITDSPSDFDIYESDNLELQKVCLEKFMDLIADAYLLYGKKDGVIQNNSALDYLYGSMKRYNVMAESKSEGHPLLKLEEHPSLLEFTEPIAIERNKDYFYSDMSEYIRTYHPELYRKWYPDAKDESPYTSLKEDMKLLKKDYSQFVSNWDTYVNKIVDTNEMKTTRHFVKALRWYQDLPIKLETLCLSLVNDPDKYKSLALLGILYESSKFEELIKQLLPQTFIVDPKDETSVKHLKQAVFYFKGMKLTNPPMPLNFLKQFFTSDYLPLCISTLDQIACRTPVPSVVNFVSTSLSDRVAVVKRLITLIATSAPIEDRCRIYKTILHSNTHSSIHGCIMLKVLKLFRTDPSEDAWNLLTECIDKKLIEDESILRELAEVKHISDKYLETYVKRMMLIFKKVKIDGCPNLEYNLISYLINQLNDEKYSQFLTVEFQLNLIQDHVFEAKFNDKPSLNESFIFNVFLHDRSQQRYSACCHVLFGMLTKFVETYFGQPLEKNDSVSYPANKLIKFIMIKFASLTVKEQLDVAIINRLLEFFEGPIKPYQDIKSYLILNWTKIYTTLLDPEKFGIEFGKNLDEWLRSFGSAFLYRMVKIVESFLFTIVLDNFQTKQNCLLKFVSGLREVKTENCYLIIAMLLYRLNESPEKKNIVEELKNTMFPTVQIFVNEYMYGTE